MIFIATKNIALSFYKVKLADRPFIFSNGTLILNCIIRSRSILVYQKYSLNRDKESHDDRYRTQICPKGKENRCYLTTLFLHFYHCICCYCYWNRSCFLLLELYYNYDLIIENLFNHVHFYCIKCRSNVHVMFRGATLQLHLTTYYIVYNSLDVHL